MNEIQQRETRLTRKQAAAYLGVSVPTMARWASKGIGPIYYVMGGKARYLVPDLDSYIVACKKAHSNETLIRGAAAS
jgi:excisionase family DNA binding protein